VDILNYYKLIGLNVRDISNTLPITKRSAINFPFELLLQKLFDMLFVDFLSHVFGKNIRIVLNGFNKFDLDDSFFQILSNEMIPGVDVSGSHAGRAILRHKHCANIVGFYDNRQIVFNANISK
jgi:hypothetical protein